MYLVLGREDRRQTGSVEPSARSPISGSPVTCERVNVAPQSSFYQATHQLKPKSLRAPVVPSGQPRAIIRDPHDQPIILAQGAHANLAAFAPLKAMFDGVGDEFIEDDCQRRRLLGRQMIGNRADVKADSHMWRDEIGLHNHGNLAGNLIDTRDTQLIRREQLVGRGDALNAFDAFEQYLLHFGILGASPAAY